MSNNFISLQSILPVAGTLLGALIGVIGTFLVNQQNRKNEELRWKREKEEKKFDLYNRILQKDGEHIVVYQEDYRDLGFQQPVYTEHIRPILYEGFHFLDEPIRELARIIDKLNSLEVIHGSTEEERGEKITRAHHYEKLITTIQSYYTN